MPKWYAPAVLDNGLQYIKDNAETLALISGYTAADSYATVKAKQIAGVTVATGDFTLSNQGTNGRKLISAAKSATALQQYDTGTAESGGASTLTDSDKSWTTNEHTGRDVTITSGTGSGQTRSIASNTATDLTVSTAWTTNPDATSLYKIVSASGAGLSQQYDSGTATAGGATTLTDSGKAWTTNAHAGRAVKITGGNGSGQVRRIASNTATALTIASQLVDNGDGTISLQTNWTTQPDTTSTYAICDDLHIAWLDDTGTTVLAVTDETSNQVVASGNTVNIPAVDLKNNQPV